MALSARAKKLVAEITNGNVKLGDLKTHGKEIKKDHALAMELWSTGEYYPRLLAILIFDNKLLSEQVIDQLASDILRHGAEERSPLADWLLANQLAKDKKLVSLMATWEKNPSPILRRWFWYHQKVRSGPEGLQWLFVEAPELDAEFEVYGNCPVQAFGTVLGRD